MTTVQLERQLLLEDRQRLLGVLVAHQPVPARDDLERRRRLPVQALSRRRVHRDRCAVAELRLECRMQLQHLRQGDRLLRRSPQAIGCSISCGQTTSQPEPARTTRHGQVWLGLGPTAATVAAIGPMPSPSWT